MRWPAARVAVHSVPPGLEYWCVGRPLRGSQASRWQRCVCPNPCCTSTDGPGGVQGRRSGVGGEGDAIMGISGTDRQANNPACWGLDRSMSAKAERHLSIQNHVAADTVFLFSK
eukprot:1161529-Pelagomonas_calceolata.AAC.15